MLLSHRLTQDDRVQIFESVRDGSMWQPRYALMLTLSTVIAAFGLLANSTAVVIGAMIIAPLMGPIIGVSLGMVSGTGDLQRKSLLAEVIGVIICIGIGYLIGRCTASIGPTPEMLARVAPTTFDLAVALACGLAGAYATVNIKVNAALAGVAISVALVPPLATCGLFLAFGQIQNGFGAFLLFFANFVSIQLAAALVFALYGFIRGEVQQEKGIRRVLLRFSPSIVALGLVGWFLTTTLTRLVREKAQDDAIRSTLFNQIARRTGGRLDSIIQVERREGEVQVVASALTPSAFEAGQVKQIEQDLEAKLKVPTTLVLRSIVSVDVGRSGRVYLSESEAERLTSASEYAAFLEKTRNVLKESLASHEAAELVEIERREGADGMTISAVVRAPEPVSPEEVSIAEAALSFSLGQPVHLVVRSISTRDADREGFLYQPIAEPPDPKVEAMRASLEPILNRRLDGLTSFQVNVSPQVVKVDADVESTLPLEPSVIAQLERDLRANVDSRIRLAVRVRLVVRGS